LPTDDTDHQQWLERTIAATDALRGLEPTVDSSLDWLATHGARTPPSFAGPLRCIHNDLSPEHLLVDRRTGALAGILDWSDAIVGDPALDFAPLAAFHGWAFVDDVVRSYPLPIDGPFRERLQFMARLLSVIWLAEAYERSAEVPTDVAKHVRWVHNVFGETGHLEETDDACTT
jgi:aminoglycoside 2''-phosphotransferase